MAKKKKNQSINEFNQVIEGTSLTKEAWKRLRKNKLAVVGLVIVCLYAFVCAIADLLPLYPYDEIVTTHQHLQPSLTKTSGELMLDKEYQNVFYNAWRQKRLVVSEEEEQKIRGWIQEDETNKVWKFLYKEGMRQIEEGTFELSESDKSTIAKAEDRIQNELMVTIKHLYADIDGERVNLEKAPIESLVSVYSVMSGASEEQITEGVKTELLASLVNTIRANDTEISQEDAKAQAQVDYDNYSEKELDRLQRENLLSKIETIASRDCLKEIRAQIAADPSIEFPQDEELTLSYGVTVDFEALRTNDRRYFLGTDYLGRDMLSRIIYGGRISIAIGLVGTITSILIGILVGSIAGYKGGRVDYYLMRFVDVMYGLPYMLLVIICMAIFGRSIFNLFFALALISWLTIARMVRGQVMSLKNQEYVEAARSMGASTWRIITKHMIPNSLSIIIVYSTIRIPNFIMQESFLSFLGLGVQAPYASWGSLIGDAVASMTLYPWKLIYPSLAMVIFLFAMNFLGDGLRDAFDPQSKNQL